MNKTFFIADTHFGHEKILDYEKRPFASANEMNAVLIENWNMRTIRPKLLRLSCLDCYCRRHK